jgi:hypothetical protein
MEASRRFTAWTSRRQDGREHFAEVRDVFGFLLTVAGMDAVAECLCAWEDRGQAEMKARGLAWPGGAADPGGIRDS